MKMTAFAGYALLLAAAAWSFAAAAGPYDHPSPPKPAPAAAPEPPPDPQDPVYQCRLGCNNSCKAFASPGLQQQCLQSCYGKCTATYEP